MKLYSEYNTILQKLAIREKLKKKKDDIAQKMESLQQEKFRVKREAASEIDIKIAQASKSLQQSISDLNYTTRDYYQTISTLLENQSFLLTPIMGQFISVNALFFSKS